MGILTTCFILGGGDKKAAVELWHLTDRHKTWYGYTMG